MTRSLWKGPFISPCFYRNKYRFPGKQITLQIYSRNSVVIPHLVGQAVNIHNGLKWVRIVISEHMVGHKFGEFAFTKKKPIHKKKQKK